jgi:hypothetical protein
MKQGDLLKQINLILPDEAGQERAVNRQTRVGFGG